MPAVLVHGVPDTAALWSPLIDHLTRTDVVTLALPGFAAPLPPGFEPTKEAYAEWVTEQIEGIGAPVDLVGHDWGGLLVQRVASVRPDLVRTLATGSGACDVEYEWHATAQIWQTPGAGEQLMDAMLAMSVDDRTAALVAGSAPPGLAPKEAAAVDATMTRCILGLYRSAVNVGAEWQPAVEAMPHRPALVLWGADDPFVTPRFGERLAARLNARLVMFDGCGHWWPWARAGESAAALETLWADAPPA